MRTSWSTSAPVGAWLRRRPSGFERAEGRRLQLEALERPAAALLDLRWHSRQRDQRAELAAAALELEGGHVVLDAVVVGGQSGRAAQVDRAVRADQPGAGVGVTRTAPDDRGHKRGRDDCGSHE